LTAEPDTTANLEVLHFAYHLNRSIWNMESGQQSSSPTREIRVELGSVTYPIYIGTQWLGGISRVLQRDARDLSHAMVICDASVASTFAELVRHSIDALGVRTDMCIVPSGETAKGVSQLTRLWDWMLTRGADRRSIVVAVGGGVVGDLAGFAAATYQRGIRLVHIPTTLLAQVDSSVGGKTGINLPGGKNIIGAFWQPLMVAIDTNTLGSLPRREFASGIAEIIKYGVIERPELFAWLEEHAAALLSRDAPAVTHAISISCLTKAAIVGEDERETSGRRAILNYGHTFAHAIETTAGFGRFLHGEAVAMGMQMAAACALGRGLVDREFVDRQRHLIEAFQLPTRWPQAEPKQMLVAMQSDKKKEHGKLRLILPTRLGHVDLVDDLTEDEIAAAILDPHQEGR